MPSGQCTHRGIGPASPQSLSYHYHRLSEKEEKTMGVWECCDVNTRENEKKPQKTQTLAQRISSSTKAVRRSETSRSSTSATEEPRLKELRSVERVTAWG